MCIHSARVQRIACFFVNNHVKMDGGVVYWTSANGKLSSCSFVNNHAKFKGNVIYWDNPGDIFACTFSVFRPKNTNTVTVNNLIYYEKNKVLFKKQLENLKKKLIL